MMRTFDNIIYKRHHLIMDETKVMEALRIIQKTCDRLFTQIQIDMTVGSCGWKNSTMWYINLTCSNTEWRNLIKELSIVRVFSNRDIPQNYSYVYTTDWAHEGSFFFLREICTFCYERKVIIMLIAFIVYLVVGVLVMVATANIWICRVQGWSLLCTIINVVCTTLVAPICLIICCVHEIYRALH